MTKRLEPGSQYSRYDVFKNPPIVSEDRWVQYLRVNGIKWSDIILAKKRLEEHKLEESTLLQKVAGFLWYGFIEATGGITPKMLVKILTDLDKLLPFVADPLTKQIIMILDKIAEEIYKGM